MTLSATVPLPFPSVPPPNKHLHCRDNLTIMLHRTSMETDVGNSVLPARIHATADLDFDVAVMNQFWIFRTDDFFQFKCCSCAV